MVLVLTVGARQGFSVHDPRIVLDRTITSLDQKIRSLMERVLLCIKEEDFFHVKEEIETCLCDIEKISIQFDELYRLDRVAREWTRLSEKINVLFENIYIVRLHASRLYEFASLQRRIDQLRTRAYAEEKMNPKRQADMAREFLEIDLSVSSMEGGFKVRPLVACQEPVFKRLQQNVGELKEDLLRLEVLEKPSSKSEQA